MDSIIPFIQSYLASGEISILALALVFVAGILTSTTPCVYPMIPITIGIFGYEGSNKQNKETQQKIFRYVGPIIYVGGLSVVYGSLGIFAAASGKMFGEISTNPLAYILMANLSLGFALWMMGWIQLPQFSFGQTLQQSTSKPYLRLFLMGGASGLVAAPCTAPVLGMLLMYIATTGDVIYGGILMIVFSYGLGSLLLVLAFSSQWLARRPKSGKWMNYSKYFMALLMLVSGEYFLIEAGKLLF